METEIQKTKKDDLFKVDPRNIIIDEDFNVRKDYGDMEELCQSVIANGVIEPVICAKVRGEDKYLLTDGFRRMRAVLMAIERGHDIAFVKVVPATGNMEDRILQMIITGTGKKPLTMLEEGDAYKRLVAYEYEPKEIAKKLGKSTAHVYNLLKLADTPNKVKKMIETDKITATTVVQLMRNVKTADDLINVVEKAVADANIGVADGKTRKATAKNVAGLKSPIQKLKEAYGIAEENGATKLDFLAELINELTKKESTAETVAKLFK